MGAPEVVIAITPIGMVLKVEEILDGLPGVTMYWYLTP